MNFASSEVSDDNIIDRMRERDLKILFCGDDTWLRLYPDRFLDDSEGTVSFYVNDYTEVDDNVTRCMARKLNKENLEEWDVMILHYLGLDHIGHSLGGEDGMLEVKLVEMDVVIERIYSTLSQGVSGRLWMVVTGDHGMTEAGSHGGSTRRETFVPMVLIGGDGTLKESDISSGISQKVTKSIREVEQVDMCTTLAYMLDLGIPTGSLGMNLVPRVAGGRRGSGRLSVGDKGDKDGDNDIRMEDAFHLSAFPSEYSDDLMWCVERGVQMVREGFCLDGANGEYGGMEYGEFFEKCEMIMDSAQSQLLKSQTSFNMTLILGGVLGSVLVTILTILIVVKHWQIINSINNINNWSVLKKLICLLLVVEFGIFFGSSLIEEEHDVQYFLLTTSLFVMAANELRFILVDCLNDSKEWNGGFLVCNASKWVWIKRRRLIMVIGLLVLHRLGRTFTEGTRRRWLLERAEGGADGG
ncbi:unnamed protein product [Anisakis simplex]|uniref:GPI ethanolamine phosphate transferase 2 n=1 Tax=Anisakis simplex TaxID=6269 RepID=A0A3P6TAE3_ANISI|nr:unnamed protein product [Anisakis simplex]